MPRCKQKQESGSDGLFTQSLQHWWSDTAFIDLYHRLPDLVEYIEKPLLDGLKDISSYVRRAAVLGCAKLFHLNPDFITGESIGIY